MEIRKLAEKSPAMRYGILGGIAVLVAIFLLLQYRGPHELDKAWFTTDDGVTWFADDMTKVAPFDHDGKTAVECKVYTYDGGKTKFVGYLIRYRPGTTALLQALNPPSSTRGAEADEYADKRVAILKANRELKRPKTGDDGWVLEKSSPESMDIITIKGQKGGELQSVFP